MDNLSPSDRLKTMRAVMGKGTRLERRVFAMMAGMGLKGWKIHPQGIPGNPDAAFIERKIAIFINGCFWHGCPVCKRPLPVANAGYWSRKIARNVQRDERLRVELKMEGWQVVEVWEHQLKKGRGRVRRKLRSIILADKTYEGSEKRAAKSRKSS